MNTFAAAALDLNEAWNLSWEEGIQFILVLTFIYWLKKRIDLHFAQRTAKAKVRIGSDVVYKVKIVEGEVS
tara:strand:- start:71 stop:283 length:213 start_codon:yes stop_codon:yes gene_type:complete